MFMLSKWLFVNSNTANEIIKETLLYCCASYRCAYQLGGGAQTRIGYLFAGRSSVPIAAVFFGASAAVGSVCPLSSKPEAAVPGAGALDLDALGSPEGVSSGHSDQGSCALLLVADGPRKHAEVAEGS